MRADRRRFWCSGLLVPFPPRSETRRSHYWRQCLASPAMGVQSAAVRVLMPGVASTNVMTTNTTLFAIDTGGTAARMGTGRRHGG